MRCLLSAPVLYQLKHARCISVSNTNKVLDVFDSSHSFPFVNWLNGPPHFSRGIGLLL